MISIRGPSIRRKLKGVPQAAQKSRIAIEEDLNEAGWPLVQAKSVCSMSAKEAKGAPGRFLTHPAMADADPDRDRLQRKADGAALAAAGEDGFGVSGHVRSASSYAFCSRGNASPPAKMKSATPDSRSAGSCSPGLPAR